MRRAFVTLEKAEMQCSTCLYDEIEMGELKAYLSDRQLLDLSYCLIWRPKMKEKGDFHSLFK